MYVNIEKVNLIAVKHFSSHSPQIRDGFSLFTYYHVQAFLSYLLAGILLIAGATKLYDASALLGLLEELSLLSSTSRVLLATLLPIIELGLAAALFMHWKPALILPTTCLLFTFFLGFTVYGLSAGWAADCGCFGGIVESSFGWGMVIRNGIFLSLSAAGQVAYYKHLYKQG